ncbi:MAG TPA: DUF1622 domain-containing protein [Terriglobales bacterium]|nr:DUF1622 domain-containing protein [Terriglobales bacterium]
MQELFKTFAGYVALGVEAAAVLLIVIGAAQALFTMLERFFLRKGIAGIRKETWGKFGTWLLLGLEFELAADIVRTAIAPTWNEIGQLAAIASIRTFLNYFLEKDIERYTSMDLPTKGAGPEKRAA